MSLRFCITAKELRRALEKLEVAQGNGFADSTAVFKIVQANDRLDKTVGEYDDKVILKAHPTDPKMNWGACRRPEDYKLVGVLCEDVW